MAKRQYIFEATCDFTDRIVTEWIANGVKVQDDTVVNLERRAGERFIIRGIEQRKVWDADKRYRRVD